MKYLTTRSLLLNAGLLLLLVGTGILLFPQAFFAANGSTLENNPSLLSEVRAHGGLLIGCACIVLLGTFRKSISEDALILSAVVYGSFGISRLLSMIWDGMPSNTLIGSAIVELIVGGLCIISLIRAKSKRRTLMDRSSAVQAETILGN